MNHADANRSSGFTLVELLIGIVVLAVLASLAVPSLRSFILNNRLTSANYALLRSIQTARTEAAKRQKNVVLCMSANPTASNPTCSTSGVQGWIVFEDGNNDWDRTSTEELIQVQTFEATQMALLADNDQRLSFAASGFTNAAGTKTPSTSIVMCDKRGNTKVAGSSTARGMTVSATGRARTTRDYAEIGTLLTTVGSSCPT
jgi:type IV fimbrial biogenesis protein FimT